MSKFEVVAAAHDMVLAWAIEEHGYQFAKAKTDREINVERLAENVKYIVGQEMPTKWQRQLLFREGGAGLQACQSVLKICTAARAAVMYEAATKGVGFEESNAVTLDLADEASYSVHHIDKFQTMLKGPYDRAFDVRSGEEGPWRGIPLYSRSIGLAVAAICELDDQGLTPPRPGLASGYHEAWDPNIGEVYSRRFVIADDGAFIRGTM